MLLDPPLMPPLLSVMFIGLIHKGYLAQKNGTPFEIWGTGKALRQFIYSYDLGRLMVWALREYDEVLL